MLMRPMGSLGRMKQGGMGLLILLVVGLGVVINGGIGGVMGRNFCRHTGRSRSFPGCSGAIANSRHYRDSTSVIPGLAQRVLDTLRNLHESAQSQQSIFIA